MITILISTFNRYETTLPLCLMSIINQTLKPNKIVLVDDNKNKKFFDHEILKNILTLLKKFNIEFRYYYGESKGAVPALQIGLNNISEGWVLKIDDDNVLPPNALEIFKNNIKDNIGAMGGIVLDENLSSYYKNRPENIPIENNGYYNRIENIYTDLNIQMYHKQNNDIKKVEHIYSNYFFRRDLADDYPLELSPSSHREETIFTYNIFRKGYDLIIIPKIKIFHFDDNKGNSKWDKYSINNDIFFLNKLKEWKIIPEKLKIFENSDGKECKIYTKKNNIKYKII